MSINNLSAGRGAQRNVLRRKRKENKQNKTNVKFRRRGAAPAHCLRVVRARTQLL